MAQFKICGVSLKIFLGNIVKIFSKGKRYKCQICGRMILEVHSLEHAKAEEYLLELIRKDHPEWNQKDLTCLECVKYYRKLIDQTEI